ncbi:MAG: hypothetical protein MJ175_01350 [Clostridia bacterium]|nr:hypothetical protein [Clostridia bacterium]
MQNRVSINPDGSYAVRCPGYGLDIRGHKLSVLIENTVFAVLDVRSAVPMTNDDDEGFRIDAEPSIPAMVSAEITAKKAVFVWKNKSALWDKVYTLTCDHLRFTYTVTVNGRGRVDGVEYFSGDTGSGAWGSEYEFSEGFTPCISWYDYEDYTFKASLDCHRWSVLMVPPMFCYAFRCEGIARRLGLGLVAKRGEHNFNAFDYRVGRNGFRTAFKLTTDQSGHQTVDGTWEAPYIIGFGGEDPWDVMKLYSDYYYSSGIAKRCSGEKKPRFWYGPMVCGWIGHCILGVERGCRPARLATEEVYEALLKKMRAYEMHPTTLIIDDKWQEKYATATADPKQFADMRAFIDRRHAEGLRTLLWFKLWDAEGWEDQPCLISDKGEIRYDPSHPAFLAHLDKVLHRLLSADEGCYNCDGFKLDFAFYIPIGRKVHTYSGKYGVELLYELMEKIYKTAKSIKPDALINASPCHPYFASVCDHARLHDYEQKNRNNREDLERRARLFSIAMPGVLLDTDNAGFASKRDSMRWLLSQQLTGVPDLYSLMGSEGCPLGKEDFAAIAQMWDEYNAKIDADYE